jgi:superfamily II DNA/RNA helicase
MRKPPHHAIYPSTAPGNRLRAGPVLCVQEGIPSCAVYGAMDQTARKINVGKFRAGRVSFLLVTDVAARGIDIPIIDNVINYDFTPKPKLFVHRAGRAARAGRSGTAVSLVTPDDYPYLLDLHLFLSRPLRVVPPLGSGETLPKDCQGVDSWWVQHLRRTASIVSYGLTIVSVTLSFSCSARCS